MNLLGNPVFGSEKVAGAKGLGLGKLVRLHWHSLDNVIIRTEIVESSIGVSENLQRYRRMANVLAIGPYDCAWLSSIYYYVISHRAVRTRFSARGKGLAPRQQPKARHNSRPDTYFLHNHYLRFDHVLAIFSHN